MSGALDRPPNADLRRTWSEFRPALSRMWLPKLNCVKVGGKKEKSQVCSEGRSRICLATLPENVG